MKIFGGRGTRTAGKKQNSPNGKKNDKTPVGAKENEAKSKKKDPRKLAIKIAAAAILIVAAGYLGTLAFLHFYPEKPPQRAVMRSTPTPSHDPSEGSRPNTPPTSSPTQASHKYTFFVFGSEATGNTDVIMAVMFDMDNYTLDIVNIPRDTLMNVSSNYKKASNINSWGNPEAAAERFADIMGYDPDYYIAVNMSAFVRLVNAVGGIMFDVPHDMHYEDLEQNPPLRIHLNAGPQRLMGNDALGFLRYRHNYAGGDIRRIQNQQAFLKAAAEQILGGVGIANFDTILDVVWNDLKTNFENRDRNLAWFAREMLKIDPENINFHMLPANTNDSVNGLSHCTIYVDEWLELLNEKFNPFDVPITAEHLSILTRDAGGGLYVTDGQIQGSASWGGGIRSTGTPAAAPTPTPTPRPTPTPTPTPTPRPTPTPSPTPSPSPPTPSPTPTPDPSPPPDPTPTPDPSPPPDPTPTPDPTPSPDPTPPWGADDDTQVNSNTEDLGGLIYVFP